MTISLKAARVAAGMTQKDVAREIGTTTASLCRWERGERVPKVSTFFRLCELYGRNPSEISVPKK